MTAPLSPAPALTAEEAARVAVFDAAEEPEEVTAAKAAARIETDDSRERVAAWLRRFSCEDAPNVAGRDFIDLSLTWADEVIALATARAAALRGDRAPLAGQHTTDEEAHRG